jgi:hypothetical protein
MGRRDCVGVWFVLAGFTLIESAAFAQQIAIAPRLRDGDVFRLEVVRARENSARPQQNGKSSTKVDLRVVSATAQGATIEWVAGETTFENSQMAQDPIVVAASDAVRDIRLRIALNAEGEFVGLANQAEVASKLRAAMEIIVRKVMARLPADQQKGVEAMMGRILSPETLVASATREAQMYFGLNGITLTVGEAVETSIQQANPFTGGAIPTTFRIRAESATENAAVLTTTTTYDREALLQSVRALAAQSGKPVPPEELAKLPAPEMDDDGRYVLDRTVGLMREVIVNRRTAAGTNRRSDRWEIRLLNDPQR